MKDKNICEERTPDKQKAPKRWWVLLAILTAATLAVALMTTAAAYAGQRAVPSSILEQAHAEYDKLDTTTTSNDKIAITPTIITIDNTLGSTATYSVELKSEPSADVTVIITPDASLIHSMSITPLKLIFATASTQIVTVKITETLATAIAAPVIKHSSMSEDAGFIFDTTQLAEVSVEVKFSRFLPLIVSAKLSGPEEWGQVEGLAHEMRSVLACAKEREIYAGTKDFGLYHKPWGKAWARMFEDKISGPVWAIARKDPGNCASLYVAEYAGSVWYLDKVTADEITAVELRGSFDKLTSLVVRGDEIFAGDINGIHYAKIPADPAEGNEYNWQRTGVHKLVMSLTNEASSSCIYAAIWDDGARVNCPPGNWQEWTAPSAPVGDLYAVAVIGLGQDQPDFLRMGTYYGLYDWQDGSGWQKAEAPRKLTWALATQGGDKNFAGQDKGGVLAQDGDGPWSQYGSSPVMAQQTVRDLMIENNTLYAATENGIWHILISD